MNDREKKDLKFIFVVVLLATIFMLCPSPTGLTDKGERALILVIAAVVMWVREPLPPAMTALLIMVFFPFLKIISFNESVSGLGNTLIFLLLGVFIISGAIKEAGLDKRIALHLLKQARGNSRAILLMIIVAATVLTFFIPTAVGRAAILTPIALGVTTALNLKRGSNIAKSLFLAISFSSTVSSIGLMTGSISMVYISQLFEEIIGYTWTYGRWVIALFPAVIIINFVTLPVLLKLFPPEIKKIPGSKEYFNTEIKKMGKMTEKELKLTLLLFLLISFWLTEEKTGIPVAQSCILIAILTMFPGIGIVDWKKALEVIDWNVILLLGASLTMVRGLNESGAIYWLTETLFQNIKNFTPSSIGIVLIILVTIIRLGFPNLISMVSIIFPIVLSIAQSVEINPLWLGLIGVASTAMGIFLPTQSATYLTTYATGYYSTKDMFKAGIMLSFIFLLVFLFMMHIYWPLIGISP